MEQQKRLGGLSDYFEIRNTDSTGRATEVSVRKDVILRGSAPVSLLQEFIPQARVRGALPPREQHINEIVQGGSPSTHEGDFVLVYPEDDKHSTIGDYPVPGVFALDRP